MTVPRLLVVSFAATILAGAGLLLLPLCIREGAAALHPVDALFTATSAVCVTGLAVRDTGGDFTFFGQLVILGLIQVGGLGILTLSNALFAIRRRRVGMRDRMVLEETVGVHETMRASGLLLRVVVYTAVCEGIGAAILTARFALDFPFATALWMGVFHSVSAFCNAGFGLLKDNLMNYVQDPVVNLAIMSLIVMGGIGFIVVEDVWHLFLDRRRVPRPRLSFHTRVVLRTTVILIVGGALLILLLELPGTGLPGAWYHRILPAMFLSVTSRTAGFNTVDLAGLTNPTLLVTILLMAIGGSPGSTAGGIKTTTAAVLHALVLSRARNRPKVELLDRSVPADVLTKAIATAAAAFVVIIAASILMEFAEFGGKAHREVTAGFLPIVFEVVSALGTVGLSVGITPGLTAAAKLVLVACMFLGRLGTLLVANSVLGTVARVEYSLPEERIIVG